MTGIDVCRLVAGVTVSHSDALICVPLALVSPLLLLCALSIFLEIQWNPAIWSSGYYSHPVITANFLFPFGQTPVNSYLKAPLIQPPRYYSHIDGRSDGVPLCSVLLY